MEGIELQEAILVRRADATTAEEPVLPGLGRRCEGPRRKPAKSSGQAGRLRKKEGDFPP
jgi:hypothetical protein